MLLCASLAWGQVPASHYLPAIFAAIYGDSPTVSLTSPANNASFGAPASITVSADAADADGTIAKVEFYAGTTLIGTDTSVPYSITWSSVPLGAYTLTAVATDSDGNTTTSDPVTVNVVTNSGLPSVTLVSPAHNSTFAAPAPIVVSATATDTGGSIALVEFFAGTTLIGSTTAASGQTYSITWSGMASGTYSLTAKATDNLGGQTTSSAHTVVINASTSDSGKNVYFIYADQLNAPRAITNQAGTTTVWRWDSDDPFGNNAANENPGGAGAFVFNLRFPGQYYDKETNLHYNYYRDYDPAIGRYIQSDPIGLKGGVNTYAYVENNPLARVDPHGLLTVTIGGNVRLPAWLIQRFFPEYQASGFQFGVAVQLTQCGRLDPDIGAFWGGTGGGRDFGSGKATFQLGFYREGISDLSGPGFDAGFNYGPGGGTYSFDLQGNYQGFSFNFGPGYHVDITGTANQTWSIKGGYNSGRGR